MPLSGYKVTLFIREDRFGGSESHYTQITSQTGAANQALVLAKKRIALMPADVSLFAVRVSNTAAPFDTALIDPAGWAKAPKWQPGVGDDPGADQGKAVIYVSIPMPTKRPAHIYLFGVPDQALGDETMSVPERVPPSWLVQWNVYAAELQTNWGTRTVTPAAGPLGPFPVVNYQNRALDGKLQVAIAGQPAAFAVGVKVFLRNFRRTNVVYTSPNGLYTIVLVEPAVPAAGQTQFTLGANKTVDAEQIVTPGTIEVRDFTVTPYGGVPILIRATTRRRGNRFLTGPGRRRVVRTI